MKMLNLIAAIFTLYLMNLCVYALDNASMPSIITIGAVLTSEENGKIFQTAVERFNVGRSPSEPRLNATYILMSDNPIRSAKAVCDELIPQQVYVIITSHTRRNSLSPMAVSFTCGFYRIPVIGMTTRESIFSDENVHVSFMRTVPPYSDQARVWVDLLRHFGFKKIIFIHSSDQEGRAILSHFQSNAESNENQIVIEKNIQYTSGQPNFTDELAVITTLESRVILLYASTEDAEPIYRDASRLNLTDSGFAWFVTEQALLPANAPAGMIGLKLKNADDEKGHIQDSVTIIGKALDAMIRNKENISPAPKQCTAGSSQWQSGATFLQYMQEAKVYDGQTGEVTFNSLGDRTNADYNVVNILQFGESVIGTFASESVGKPPKLSMLNTTIIWPGNQVQQPRGIKISHHLKVVTIESIPFIFVESKLGDKCKTHKYVDCPRYNSSSGINEHFICCGYAIDLLVMLSNKSDFTYAVHLVEDGQYGAIEVSNQTKRWNGMIGELIYEKADLIVAPLTINQERAEEIDFSKPFKYQGLTILVKKKTRDSSLTSFLQPFEDTLWILVALSVHVVGLVLYLLDRFSPFGRFKLAKNNDAEEDALNLSSAMWFAWGVLLNSGIGEGTPRSFSARVLGMVWAGFAMIIVASYTANLAAFLVLDRPEATISGVDDARLRNPQDNFKYATVRNSAVSMYFKRQVELSTMYRTMENHNYNNPEDAIKDIKNEQLHAFIWDSSRLEYEAARDKKCELMTAGELFGRSGYGIGLKKGSPWTHNISQQILMFHENGNMEKLDTEWIQTKENNCPDKNASPATLGLQNMAGVFMMVAGGIVAGVFLILVEIAYKRHCSLKEKKMQLVKRAADRWRGNIEKRKMLRQSRQYLRSEKMASNSNGPQDPLLISVSCASPSNMGPSYDSRNSLRNSLEDNMRVAV